MNEYELLDHFITFVTELNFIFKYNHLNIVVNRLALVLSNELNEITH